MFCQNCGQQITDDTRFCPNCGSPAGAVQNPVPSPAQPVIQQTYQPTYPQPNPQQAIVRKKSKGWLVGLMIGLVVIAVLVIALIAGGGSCSVTTARLTDAAMASKIDADTMKAVTKTDVFKEGTTVIYATGLLRNAPEDTLVTSKWYYLTDDVDLATVDVKSTETSQYICFMLTMDNGFPAGDYKVELYLDDKLAETLEFKVK
jgi:hypothetical protein